MNLHTIIIIWVTFLVANDGIVSAQSVGPQVHHLSPNGSILLPKGGAGQPGVPSGNQINKSVASLGSTSMSNGYSRITQMFNQWSSSADLAIKKKPWLLCGNITSGGDFLGTINYESLVFKASSQLAGKIDLPLSNTLWGLGAGKSITTGINNTGIGFGALTVNTEGALNSATGYYALFSNIIGNANTANGYAALGANTTGNGNTAIGLASLGENTSGVLNTATGYNALYQNSGGDFNTAYGQDALGANIAGNRGTAIGTRAMARANNVKSEFTNFNVAVGFEALIGSTDTTSNTGNFNTSVGYQSLSANSTGNHNTANGHAALLANTTGDNNTAIGDNALAASTTGFNNTAIGQGALVANTTGKNNTVIGNNAGSNITTGTNNIAIGYNAEVPSPTGNDQIRIGNTTITYAGIEVPWTITSDQRLKSDIEKSNLGLDFISKLNPVSYTRNNDESGKREYGFLGQELETALSSSGADNSGMIFVDENGKYSVRYNDLLAPMVKAIQEQQGLIELQDEKIQRLTEQNAALQETLNKKLADQQNQIDALQGKE